MRNKSLYFHNKNAYNLLTWHKGTVLHYGIQTVVSGYTKDWAPNKNWAALSLFSLVDCEKQLKQKKTKLNTNTLMKCAKHQTKSMQSGSRLWKKQVKKILPESIKLERTIKKTQSQISHRQIVNCLVLKICRYYLYLVRYRNTKRV